MNEAIECFKRAIELNKKDTAALFNMALTYEEMKRFEEALDCFNKILQEDPLDKEAYSYRKIILKKMESYNVIKNWNFLSQAVKSSE